MAAVLWDVGAVFVVVIVAAVVVVDAEEVVVAAADAVGIVAAKCFCFQWKVDERPADGRLEKVIDRKTPVNDNLLVVEYSGQ